jgi:hypothetical protein
MSHDEAFRAKPTSAPFLSSEEGNKILLGSKQAHLYQLDDEFSSSRCQSSTSHSLSIPFTTPPSFINFIMSHLSGQKESDTDFPNSSLDRDDGYDSEN